MRCWLEQFCPAPPLPREAVPEGAVVAEEAVEPLRLVRAESVSRVPPVLLREQPRAQPEAPLRAHLPDQLPSLAGKTPLNDLPLRYRVGRYCQGDGSGHLPFRAAPG
jgi:hypothetical protein